MALKLNDGIFNQASNQAMQEALIKSTEERLKAMGASAFTQILTQLKTSAVDKAQIAKLEAEINSATSKNEYILNIIRKGGAMAETLLKIITK